MKLNKRSKELRLKIIELSKKNGGYHYGGSFSCVEILLSLFENVLKKQNKFILSKGHACWGYYVLLKEMGYKPLLEGHPKRDIKNGVEWTTGSEGHGLPAGIGICLARKIKNIKGNVFVLVGDGECQEGTTWESLLIAAQHNLNNLIVIIDFNKIQGSDFTKNVLNIDSIGDVAKAVGWKVSRIDGHDIGKVTRTLKTKQKLPHLIIADTIKGKGVSFMENKVKWHANGLHDDLNEKAIKELTS
tara:strand:- start:418 stop:1149 length:732 start_codon:yes stop_codon:yes gene_type:complete